MNLKVSSIRGTRDIAPASMHEWHYVEGITREVARLYGFKEIRSPIIEKTDLFTRSVGETTDVVQKEMYTFDKGSESITLRPEGTAGTVRAVLENGLLNDSLPQKLWYNIACFRHENPQAGRLREFHQFGVECFGAPSPTADAEVIGVAYDILNRLGVKDFRLEINSIGCPNCRPEYNQKLVEYFASHEDKLCNTCKQRLKTNPLRLLDCKEAACIEIAHDAPKITECLCDECGDHFLGLQQRLDILQIEYTVNPKIVRGLDYYTKTVFEFISDSGLGSQSTVCGGGRYDLLVGQMGGPETPALGFAIGLERLIMTVKACGNAIPQNDSCDIYVGSGGSQNENLKALELTTALRREGFITVCDSMGRSVKAQMKYANKINARHACIIGQNELDSRSVTVKRMNDGTEQVCRLDEIQDFVHLVRW